MKPQRIQLRRAKGWRIPENTVKVDRTTPWGNPFRVGRDGTRAECVRLYRLLLAGNLCLSTTNGHEQMETLRHVAEHLHELRGKHLACWCRLDEACHADLLLELANREAS
jgi:hypothetical protein